VYNNLMYALTENNLLQCVDSAQQDAESRAVRLRFADLICCAIEFKLQSLQDSTPYASSITVAFLSPVIIFRGCDGPLRT
jgi:hypothetical protein